MPPQNLSNHGKFFPSFHFFVLPALLINFGFSVRWWWKGSFSLAGAVNLLAAAALFVGFVCVRVMAMKVQDRVIRLEERVRFERVLPADLQARIPEFTIDQLVALRFASNSELPELARKVLDENVKDRKAIKQMIKTWRPDFARA